MNILIVLTSQKTIGNTSKETGFHFSEFSHAYEFFDNLGYKIVVASPLGGECSITSPHTEDKINAHFYEDPEKINIIKQTAKLDDVKNEHFDAVYIAGGHGAMFDFPHNLTLAAIINGTLRDGGVVGAVCHGPAAFVGVKDNKGRYLVDGKRINSFTNIEEKATQYYNDLPFLLESKLVEQGAKFESSGPRKPHLTIDSRIITGQNPESVDSVTEAIHNFFAKEGLSYKD